MKFAKIVSLVFVICFLVSCGNKKDSYDPNVYYTCSMHQQIHESTPGKCPICHMDLTKVTIDPNQKNKLKLSETQIQLANIVVDTVGVGKINEEIQLHAKLTVNENTIKTITSRVPGRIETLYFKNTGDYIHKGDVLYSIYSEELLSAQKDYLFALDRLKAKLNNPDYAQIVQSSKNKLLLWGMSETQIEKLKSSNDLSTSVPIYSTFTGTIQELKIKEGETVFEGSSIVQIADLSTLWIEAQVFSNETEYIREHQPVNVIISAFPNETLTGKIDFVSPELQSDGKIIVARVELNNLSKKYVPGMLAIVHVKTREKEGLILPLNAVLQSQKGNTVWIQNNEGSFEVRMVTTGIQNSDSVEIVSGLNEKEKVVISGAYLLNSEYILKNGNDPMSGMKM